MWQRTQTIVRIQKHDIKKFYVLHNQRGFWFPNLLGWLSLIHLFKNFDSYNLEAVISWINRPFFTDEFLDYILYYNEAEIKILKEKKKLNEILEIKDIEEYTKRICNLWFDNNDWYCFVDYIWKEIKLRYVLSSGDIVSPKEYLKNTTDKTSYTKERKKTINIYKDIYWINLDKKINTI